MSHIIKMNCCWRTPTTAYRFMNLEAPPLPDKQGQPWLPLQLCRAQAASGNLGFAGSLGFSGE